MGIKNYVDRKFKPLTKQDHHKNSKNIELELQRRAMITTADFVIENLLDVDCFDDKFHLLKSSINLAKIDGLWLEFGVYKGTTINYISKIKVDKTIYGFDSFEGLPERWRGRIVQGTFALSKKPRVNKNVKLIEGWFEDTLPSFCQDNSGPISFLHVDCDIYSSTKTVFDNLKTRISKGTVIVFDEFFNYFGWEKGEYKAFMEFIESVDFKFRYIGYCFDDEQVAVIIE